MPSTSTEMLRSRLIIVTLGLACSGAILGALAAMASISLLVSLRMGLGAVANASVLLPWIALKGAEAGAVAFPAAAWLLLRRVAVGHALLGAGAAIVVGAIVGELLRPFNPYSQNVPGLLLGAVSGFALGVSALRLSLGRVRQLDQAA